MQVHLVVDGDTLEVRRGYLSEPEARRACKNGDIILDPVEIESPMELVRRYFQFRRMEMPEDEFHALAFLTSELGELNDALVSTIPPKISNCPGCGANQVSSAGKWVRNNPDKDRNPELEAGDVLMILYVALKRRGIDPYEGMVKKFRSKGFTDAQAAS